MRQIVTLALYSRRQLQALRAETSLAYDHLERGILHVYTDRSEFATAIKAAAVMREFGCERRTVTSTSARHRTGTRAGASGCWSAETIRPPTSPAMPIASLSSSPAGARRAALFFATA
jgi:hypothetical protein